MTWKYSDHVRCACKGPDGKLLAVWTGFGNPFGLLVVGKELLVTDGDAWCL